MRRAIFILFVLGVLLSGNVLASFVAKNGSVDTKYSTGDTIRGRVNMSFDNEPASSKFTSNFEGNITLLDLLRKSGFVEGEDFDCSLTGCGEQYTKDTSISSFDISGNKTVGFALSGANIENIESIKLHVQSSAGPSCLNQLTVDFLGNGEGEIINTKHTTSLCGVKSYGCFQQENSPTYAEISTTPYCEKMTFPTAAGFSVGARIKDSTSGTADLIMSVYDTDGVFIGSCTLPKNSQSEEDLSCTLDISFPEQKDVMVCVKAKSSGAHYSIPAETKNPCGNTNPASKTFTRDFQIFSQPLQFDSVDFNINDSTFASVYGLRLSDFVYDYVDEKYAGNCENECVIPITFEGDQQTINVDDASLRYMSDGALLNSETLYTLQKENAKIDSVFHVLDLGKAGFTIPLNSTEKKFKLMLGAKNVFEQTINITKGFTFDITPKFVALGQNVLFTASSNESLKESRWEFGDGSNVFVSTSNQASHRYLAEGTYDLQVTLEKKDGTQSTRTFTITVGEAKESANATLVSYRNRLGVVDKTLRTYPLWMQEAIDGVLDTDTINSTLVSLQDQYDGATTDEDYAVVMRSLIDLDVPYNITTTRKASLPLAFGFDALDTRYIEEISGKEVEDADALKAGIISWFNEYYTATVDFASLAAPSDSGSSALGTQFTIRVNPQKTGPSSYLILGYSSEGIKFKQDYGQKELTGGTYIPISGAGTYEFFVTSDIAPEELGAYIAPNVDSIGDFETIEPYVPEKPVFRWGFFFTWLIIILACGLVVYIALQEWYKRNYERSLFKQDTELYNIINFIYNARRAGAEDSTIKSRLKENKWNGEQISYAFKKIDGKRTGMYEIPIFKFLENRRVKEEISRRQSNPVDARFIKRPEY